MGALVWLIILIDRERFANTYPERLFLLLLVLSMYSTGETMGNGQLGIHVLPILLSSLLIARKARPSWFKDILVALLMLFCLVKPSITVPFMLLLAVDKNGLKPVILSIGMYISITLSACAFQEPSSILLIKQWLIKSKITLNDSGGYTNVHQWMNAIGAGNWVLPVFLVLVVLLSWWLYVYRHEDLWLLMGVTAIIARLWTYHAPYDDILILILFIALFRIIKLQLSLGGIAIIPTTLVVLSWFSMLLPTIFLEVLRWFPMPLPPRPLTHQSLRVFLFKSGQALLWLLMMVFLMMHVGWQSQCSRRKVVRSRGRSQSTTWL